MEKIDIENNQNHSQDIKRQLRELSSLVEMNKKIHSTMNIERLLQILVEQAVIGVNFERGLIYLLEDRFLRCVASLDRVKPEKGAMIKDLVGFRMDETAVEVLAVNTGQSFYVKDALTDPSVSKKLLRVTDTKEYCVVPLIGRAGVLGVMTGDKIYSQRPIQPEDIRTLELFAGHISLAVENAALFRDKEHFAALLKKKVLERTSELEKANQEILDQKNQLEALSKRLKHENICLREKMKADQDKKFVIGDSPAMNEIMDLVIKVAHTTTSVIVYGETGTGKELIASAIHEMSPRKLKPMVKVNCAAIPEELLESELFGHEKGAFTGAVERRGGMFQLAEGGTIFLDEIGDISLKTQTKLLRVLQEGEIQPLGSEKPIRVDVRVIAATNKDLKRKIEEETFRSDLFYRLNVFPITMPPLRDRGEDIPKLVDFFLEKYTHLKKGKIGIDKEVIEVFLRYSWPGNIRELENIIERLMIISKPGNITVGDLPKEFSIDVSEGLTIRPLNIAVLDFKRETVKRVLGMTGGKKSEAATMLGMPKSNFSRLLKQLGMT
jgi:transcriptional regulator with GAF, ATPase, and Fis domain